MAVSTLAAVGIISFIAARNRSQQPSFKFSYLRKHGQKAKKLQDLMEELSVRANDIKRRSDISELQLGKGPNDAITSWLEDVERIQKESYWLMGEVSERKRCLHGRLPNYNSRLKLGKLMELKTKEVIVLLGEARFLDDPRK